MRVKQSCEDNDARTFENKNNAKPQEPSQEPEGLANKVAQVKSLLIPEATKGGEGSDSLGRRWIKVMGAEDEPDASD